MSPPLPCNQYGYSSGAHCSYLEIYVSRKIRLCVVDLESKFQTNLQAKDTTFGLEIRIYYSHFSSIFAGFVKSSAFYTLLLLFQTVDMFEL